MGDAKLVTKGLKTDFSGDVNLFGHEHNPNLQELKKYLDKRIHFISDSIEKFESSGSKDRFNIISDLTDLVTEMIKRIRAYHKSEKQKLVRYTDGSYAAKPDKAISACKTNMYTASIWVIKSLRINNKLFVMMRNFQDNVTTKADGKQIKLTEFHNLHLLHNSDYIAKEIDKYEYPHLIRKYSDEWKEMVKESFIRDECIADCLGWNGSAKLNNYVRTYLKEECDPHDFSLNQKSNAEVDGMATIVMKFMPALLPSCAVMYEEGCSFLHTLYIGNSCVYLHCV